MIEYIQKIALKIHGVTKIYVLAINILSNLKKLILILHLQLIEPVSVLK